MTFDLHEGHHHLKLASVVLLTKFGGHRALFNIFDPNVGILHINILHSKIIMTCICMTHFRASTVFLLQDGVTVRYFTGIQFNCMKAPFGVPGSL